MGSRGWKRQVRRVRADVRIALRKEAVRVMLASPFVREEFCQAQAAIQSAWAEVLRPHR